MHRSLRVKDLCTIFMVIGVIEILLSYFLYRLKFYFHELLVIELNFLQCVSFLNYALIQLLYNNNNNNIFICTGFHRRGVQKRGEIVGFMESEGKFESFGVYVCSRRLPTSQRYQRGPL